jgi:acyl-CoA synthetase (AMP-forming)/AMP-acid ligase II
VSSKRKAKVIEVAEPEPASTLPALLAQHVQVRGAQDAVATVDETLSYTELDRRSAKLARAMLALGAGKGTRVALLAPGGIFWLTALLAGLRIGALVSLVSTLCTPPELAHILRYGDCQILIGVRRFMRHDYAKVLTIALPELALSQARAVRVCAAPHLRSIWFDDARGLDWARSLEELLRGAEGPNVPDAALLSAAEREVGSGDDAVIVYTSGSTSVPKAVIHTQWTVTRFARELTKYFVLKPNDRMMPHLPIFWLGGLGMTMQVLSIGATLVYPTSPEVEAAVDAIERCRANRINSWGDVLTKLRAAASERGIDVESIVGLGSFRDRSGRPIEPELRANLLGMSETFTTHSAEPIDLPLPREKAGASGRAVTGFERRVVHPETGETLPPGEIGELQVRGGGLMSGLYKVSRDKVFTADGFYPTGDLVRIDTDGYLFFVARRGDMIKTKAANVSRLEVEAAMRTLPEVDLPIVVGLPDPELGQRVVAAVVPKPWAVTSEASLRAQLRDILSSYKIPRQIVLITHDEVPRTTTGKIKLYELAGMVAARMGGCAPPS